MFPTTLRWVPEGDSLLSMLELALAAGHGDLHPLALQQQLDLEQGHPTFCSCPILYSQQQGQELPITEALVLQKLLWEGREEQSL